VALTEIHEKFHLSNEFSIRPAQFDDVQAVVDLMNAHEFEFMGIAGNNHDDLLRNWQSPGFNVQTDTTLVLTKDGQFVGYGAVVNTNPPHVTAWVWGAVHPDFKNRGIGSYLMNWFEARGRLDIEKAPANARVVLMTESYYTNAESAALYVRHDYTLIRHGLRMVIDVENNDVPAAVLPEGIVVRSFVRGQDDEATYRAFQESFQDHWGHVEEPFETGFPDFQHWYQADKRWDPTVWFLAMDGDEIAGVSLCSNHFDGEPDMAYVSVLGIRRPWRRQGLALALLHHTFTEFKGRGRKKVSLHVDGFSLTGATKLYEKAGMHKDHQWDIYEKELRAGDDLTTQKVE
jgi:mycothiol synthase